MLPKIQITLDSYSPIPLNQSSIYELATKIKTDYGRVIQQELKHYLRIADHINEAFTQPSVDAEVDIVKPAGIDAIVIIPLSSSIKMICSMSIDRNHISIEGIQISDSQGYQDPIVFLAFGCHIISLDDDYDLVSFHHSCYVKLNVPSGLAQALNDSFPKDFQQTICCHSNLFSNLKVPYVEPTINEFRALVKALF